MTNKHDSVDQPQEVDIVSLNAGITLAGVLVVAGIWLTSWWMDRLYNQHGPENEPEEQHIRRN